MLFLVFCFASNPFIDALTSVSHIVDIVVGVTTELPVFERFLTTSGTAVTQLTKCQALIADTTALSALVTGLAGSDFVLNMTSTFTQLVPLVGNVSTISAALLTHGEATNLTSVAQSDVADTSGLLYGVAIAGDVQSLTLVTPSSNESFSTFNAVQWSSSVASDSLVVSQLVGTSSTPAFPSWYTAATAAAATTQSKLNELDGVTGVLLSLASQTDTTALSSKLTVALPQLQVLNDSLVAQQQALSVLSRVSSSVLTAVAAGQRLQTVMCNATNVAAVRSARSLQSRLATGAVTAARRSLQALLADLATKKAVAALAANTTALPAVPKITAFENALSALRKVNSSPFSSLTDAMRAFVATDVNNVDDKLLPALIATSAYTTVFNDSFNSFTGTLKRGLGSWSCLWGEGLQRGDSSVVVYLWSW